MQFSNTVFVREFPEIESFIYSGSINEAHEYLEPMLEADRPPTHVMLAKANVWAAEGQFEKAIHILRTAMPDARGQLRELLRYYLQRLLSACCMTAEAFDLFDGVAPDQSLTLFISGGVGSGFDGVSLGLAETVQWPILRAVEGGFQNEADIRVATLEKMSDKPCVISQSARCTESNLLALQVFSPRVVVVCRNIFDCLSMLGKYLKTEGDITGFLRDEVKTWSEQEILSYAVDKWAAWYISHYASWYLAHVQGRLDVLFVDYEHWSQDPKTCYEKILDHTQIAAQINAEALQEHQPIVMRSDDNHWTPELRSKVEALKSCYSEVDFEPIGL